MTILEHPDAQALLDDAVVTADQIRELSSRIQPFLERYLPLFHRSEQRSNASFLLMGKLSSLSRKTAEPIAHFFAINREPLQDFLGVSPWLDRSLLDAIRQHVTEVWGDPHAVLTGDGSAFPKKGVHSCGVKRQHCGRLGKVDNCQVGIFLGYACRRGHTLLDHRLFLPHEWIDDANLRKETGIPDAVIYKERWEILLDLIDANKDIPHEWVAADSEFGRVNAFRAGLRQREERYVVDVRDDLRFRDLRAKPPPRQGTTGRIPTVPPTTNASAWAKSQPAAAWQRFKLRAGEKMPLVVEAIETWVETFEDNTCIGPVERFCVIRTVDNPEPKTWFTLSNAPKEVLLGELVHGHAQRYWEEASFKDGKSEVGMAEYEVRGWTGWHHHMSMSVLALWFLCLENDRVQKKTPAMTVSALREVFSRLLALQVLTIESITAELNETLRRKEEARIYAWHKKTKAYPPRRNGANETTAGGAETHPPRSPPHEHLQ